eukprot:TRINITY_DN910_c0_g1_i14.p1 TRINITY_DN910_c0_g1~~TRINITY_DN910_c0_g1_i14.p1  ORF type:complete len:1283 (-),score=166.15 TRINITY_DN910_c0_g1_i14:12817-16665(-)
MTFANNYPSLSSKYANNYPPPASFTRKRPYTPPRPLSPAYSHFSPTRHPHSGRLRRREPDSPHSSSHSSYTVPLRRPQKRRRSAPVSSAVPRDPHDASHAQPANIFCATFSQAALCCIALRSGGLAHVCDVSPNPQSLKLRSTLRHPGKVFRGALSSDASIAVTTCQDGNARVWSASGVDYMPKTLSFPRPFRNARACALSPDARYAAVSFYRGLKRLVDDHDFISSFQSQIFIVHLQTNAPIFDVLEPGIADQVILSENASVIAIGLHGVSPARKIARRHKIALYKRDRTAIAAIRDRFPPEKPGCTAWHMSATGDMLALCSRNNDLEVYRSGPRKDWAQEPTVLRPHAFHSFSQCRFGRNPDILAAIGSNAKSRDSILGLFRVSNATLLFTIPVQVSICNVLDIYPYVSLSNRMETENAIHTVAVVSINSGKTSNPGLPLSLYQLSESKEPKRKERLPPPEMKSTASEQQTREPVPVHNSSKSLRPLSRATPFRLCRDPSPIHQMRLESPSASRSSAAMKSSESSAQTPLHNRFASWLNDDHMKPTQTSETESQNSRRGGKVSRAGGKGSLLSSGKEGALKCTDPSQTEKDVTQKELDTSSNANTAEVIENEKVKILRDVDGHIASQDSLKKSQGIVKTGERVRRTKTSSVPDLKNSEAQNNPQPQSKKSKSPSSAERVLNPASSKENPQKNVRKRVPALDGKEKSTLRPSKTEQKNNSNTEKEGPAIHAGGAPSAQNLKSLKLSLPVKGENGDSEGDKLQGSCNPQRQEEKLVTQSKQSAPGKAYLKTERRQISSEQVSHVPGQNSEASMHELKETEQLMSAVSDGKKDNAVVPKEGGERCCFSAGSPNKVNIDHTPLDDACEKEKCENTSVISTPQSDDWTPATRFAAREHKRLGRTESTGTENGTVHTIPLTLKKGMPANFQSSEDANQKHVDVACEKGEYAPQNVMRDGSLFNSTRNSELHSLNKGSYDQNISTKPKIVKKEAQPCVVEEFVGNPGLGMEEKSAARENQRREVCAVDLVSPQYRGPQTVEVGKAVVSGEGVDESKPESCRVVSVSNGIQSKISSAEGKQFQAVPVPLGGKEARWSAVRVEKGPEQHAMSEQEDERDDHDNHTTIPARLLQECRKAFSDACRNFRVPDMNTLTNQEAYTTMLRFTQNELCYAEKKGIAKIIYDIVGSQNACSLQMFIDAFGLILARVKASRREQWTEVFSRATCKEGESILVFHARDLLKLEHVHGNIRMAEKWTDDALESLFERVADGMLVDLTSFLQSVDEVLDS